MSLLYTPIEQSWYQHLNRSEKWTIRGTQPTVRDTGLLVDDNCNNTQILQSLLRGDTPDTQILTSREIQSLSVKIPTLLRPAREFLVPELMPYYSHTGIILTDVGSQAAQ